MVTQAAFINDGRSLRPVEPRAFELMRGFKMGQRVMVEAWSPRNIDQHRLFFGVLGKVVENSETWTDVDTLRDALLLETQHVDVRRNLAGRVYVIPKSLRFASMPQAEFAKVFDDVMRVIETAILPGIDREALTNEVWELLHRPVSKTTHRRAA